MFRGGASWRRRRLFAFPPVKTRCRLLVMLASAMWRCFPGTPRASSAESRSPHAAIQGLWGLCGTWSIVLLPWLCFTCTPGIALQGHGHPQEALGETGRGKNPNPVCTVASITCKYQPPCCSMQHQAPRGLFSGTPVRCRVPTPLLEPGWGARMQVGLVGSCSVEMGSPPARSWFTAGC